MVTPEFLALVHRLLMLGGRFRVVTDQQNYFEAMRAFISADMFLEVAPAADEIFPITTFEKHFIADGVSIYRLVLRKVG